MAFFRYIDDELQIAPNFVCAPTFTLLKEDKDTYTFPMDGWYWFDTTENACNFFNIDPTPYIPTDV